MPEISITVTLDLSERNFLRLKSALLEAEQRHVDIGQRDEAAALADVRRHLVASSEFPPFRTVPRGVVS